MSPSSRRGKPWGPKASMQQLLFMFVTNNFRHKVVLDGAEFSPPLESSSSIHRPAAADVGSVGCRLSNVARDAAPHKAHRIVCVVVFGRRRRLIRRRMLQLQRERRTIGVARCRSTGMMQRRHRGMRADSEFQDAGTTRETTSSSSSSMTMGGGRRDATRRWRENVRSTWRSSALSFR
jgi:hypothetical protein